MGIPYWLVSNQDTHRLAYSKSVSYWFQAIEKKKESKTMWAALFTRTEWEKKSKVREDEQRTK